MQNTSTLLDNRRQADESNLESEISWGRCNFWMQVCTSHVAKDSNDQRPDLRLWIGTTVYDSDMISLKS